MSVTIKTTTLKYKDPTTGEYLGVDAVAETTTAEQVAAVEAAGAEQVDAVGDKGAEVLESIPSDYTELSEDVADLKSAMDETRKGYETIQSADIIQGTFNRYGSVVSNSKRIRTKEFVRVLAGSEIHFIPGTNAAEMLLGVFTDAKEYVNDSQWYTTEQTIPITSDGYYIIVFRTANDASNITPAQFDATVTISYSDSVKISEICEAIGEEAYMLEWEQGTINADGSLSNDDKRIRTAQYYYMPPSLSVLILNNSPAKKYTVKQFNDNGSIISDTGWLMSSGVITRSNGATKFKLSFAFHPDADITPESGSALSVCAKYENIGKTVDETVQYLNKTYEYTYTGEKFPAKVNGFDAIKVKTITYSGSSLNDIVAYGNYMLCFINPGTIQIYNKTTWEKLSEITITKDGEAQSEHLFVVNASNTFYDEGDLFPLIYAAVGTGGIYDVIRIPDVNTATVVKQYKFSSETSGSQPLVVFDFAGGIGYGLNIINSESKLVKYDLTDETANEDGTYSFAVISTGNCPNLNVRQGAKYYNGRVYEFTCEQVTSPYGNKLVVLNCDDTNAVVAAEYDTLPIAEEAEGIAIAIENGRAVMYLTGYFQIYRLTFAD